MLLSQLLHDHIHANYNTDEIFAMSLWRIKDNIQLIDMSGCIVCGKISGNMI